MIVIDSLYLVSCYYNWPGTYSQLSGQVQETSMESEGLDEVCIFMFSITSYCHVALVVGVFSHYLGSRHSFCSIDQYPMTFFFTNEWLHVPYRAGPRISVQAMTIKRMLLRTNSKLCLCALQMLFKRAGLFLNIVLLCLNLLTPATKSPPFKAGD
jgi:hypothetical protein